MHHILCHRHATKKFHIVLSEAARDLRAYGGFARTVDYMDTDVLLQLFTKRMEPLFLADLAHAALASARRSAEEEIVHNPSDILHNVTVLENQTSQKDGVNSLTSTQQLSIRKHMAEMHGEDAPLHASFSLPAKETISQNALILFSSSWLFDCMGFRI